MALKLPCGSFLGTVENACHLENSCLSLTTYSAGSRQEPHTHAFPHICLTVDGAYSEKRGRRQWDVRRGDLTFYHPDQVHAERHQACGIHFLVEFSSGNQSPLHPFLPQFDRKPISGGECVSLAWRLFREFRNPDIFSKLAMESLAMELAVACFREARKDPHRKRPTWMKSAREFLHSHFVMPPSLSEISRVVGVHPVHLAKTFRKFEGVTVGEYIRILRVDAAREKLSHSRHSLAHIALECGFADQTHFTRVFKRVTGMTPGHFRLLASQR